MYLLGLDIGSSSVKAALVAAENGKVVARTQYPNKEMDIQAPQPGWAEQDPAAWWGATVKATRRLFQHSNTDAAEVRAIGISYQMHGLVLLDKNLEVLRPSIIWCDGRAVAQGEAALAGIGQEFALQRLLNAPGNFTASKLRWVQENEPELYRNIRYFMLPGDYIATRLTGTPATTVSGLSEGILWDFQTLRPADIVLRQMDIAPTLIPPLTPTFGIQGTVSAAVAGELGLRAGIPVAYRAGDQPNNALSLNALEAGEVAATGGTSGVVYAVTDRPMYDPQSRVNGFAHVNYTAEQQRIGILLCINGTGITYNWLRRISGNAAVAYPELEKRAAGISVGAEGVQMLPFGNGAERILNNRDIGAHIAGLQFNRHNEAHLIRAGLEGVAFAFAYGMDILKDMGLDLRVIRAGNDNLFQSRIFSKTVATLSGSRIELLDTTGAVGAAKAAGFGAGIYASLQEALGQTPRDGDYEPAADNAPYREAYHRWRALLATHIG